MVSRTKLRYYATTLLGIGVALAVAACGGSSGSHSSKHAASSTPASTNTSATSVIVKTAHGAAGTYLVGPSGHALYLWVADRKNKSVCAGACAKFWPPLTTTGKPSAAGGAMASHLGTIKRSDGKLQVTYNGHPLYYFAEDTKPGLTAGQGNNGFGAKWWLVSPAGQAITKAASSSHTSTSTGGGGAYSGSSSTSSSSGSSSWG